jgi:hypothetical protein
MFDDCQNNGFDCPFSVERGLRLYGKMSTLTTDSGIFFLLSGQAMKQRITSANGGGLEISIVKCYYLTV